MNILKTKTILITGSAGFIGFHLAKKLLENDIKIIGIDNFNDYYDINLKLNRNKILKKYKNFKLLKGDIADLNFIKKVFKNENIDKICHLAAQAGIRYSLENPHKYITSNIVGFTNLIDEAKNNKIKDFVFASSSSVYGNNKNIPFTETDKVDNPISLYAATKKADELIAYTYSYLYDLNCTGLRFFTVYGPYGRPDMAYSLFTKAILENKSIQVYNSGNLERDFTYIDDIVDGIIKALTHPFRYEIFNLGNNKPIKLRQFIKIIEKELGIKAKKQMLPMQPGDVNKTYADLSKSKKMLGFEPKINIEEGLKKFINWFREYYKI